MWTDFLKITTTEKTVISRFGQTDRHQLSQIKQFLNSIQQVRTSEEIFGLDFFFFFFSSYFDDVKVVCFVYIFTEQN